GGGGAGRRGASVNVRQAILNPDETIRRGYETVEVRLANGQLVRGVTKNEDTFSIQIMDENEKLHMLLKRDLKEIHRSRKSLMPAARLSPVELENVLAFLAKKESLNPPPAV